MTQFQMILGSKHFLRHYFTDYDTPLVLLKSLEKGRNYALLDLAAAIPFVAPMAYTQVAGAQPIPTSGFFNLMYFGVSDADEPVFVAKVRRLIDHHAQLRGCTSITLFKANTKEIEYLLLTSWEKKLDVFASRHMPLVTPVMAYMDRAAAAGGYHEAIYTAVAPNTDNDDDDEEKD
ncbi:hypothetical protein [Lacticaseibacillus nasuensis]|nr:hypothetical protein [Lacticaseibacillus nasuensis]